MTKPRKRAPRSAERPSTQAETSPCFDVWICEGRMCRSFGAEELSARGPAALVGRDDAERVRFLRGGCFGLCELAANVVVRRHRDHSALPSTDEDRLSLTHAPNETVYSQVGAEGLSRLLAAHLDDDRADDTQTQRAREEAIGPRSTIAERMRLLRERRRARAG